MRIKKRERGNWLGILCVIAFAVSVLLLLIAAMVSAVPDFSGQPHQADAVLIANFNAHRAEFEKLRQMILEDKGLTRVDDDWTSPDDPQSIGIKPERIAVYRRLFQHLGIARGFSAASDRERIELWASAQGWVAHGSSKGYLYTNIHPHNIIDNLDGLSTKGRPVGSGTRHIEGNWYLYFAGD